MSRVYSRTKFHPRNEHTNQQNSFASSAGTEVCNIDHKDKVASVDNGAHEAKYFGSHTRLLNILVTTREITREKKTTLCRNDGKSETGDVRVLLFCLQRAPTQRVLTKLERQFLNGDRMGT